MTRVVAIHQPNFFPWLGYFDKIARSDTFIFLDDVQFPKTGGVWSNRVKILLAGEPRWVTAPVERNSKGTRLVNEMQFSGDGDWRGKLLKTLVNSYRRTLFFEETFEVIEPLVLNHESNVAEYNIRAIKILASAIGLSTDSMIRSSDCLTDACSTELLIELTKWAGGEAYLCGAGAGGYQEDGAFQKANIVLEYQNFNHLEYPQLGSVTFCGGLSIIDVAMNLGWQGVRELLALPHSLEA
jgi:hypothetical protein